MHGVRGVMDCGMCTCEVKATGNIEVNCVGKNLDSMPEFLNNGSFSNVTVM